VELAGQKSALSTRLKELEEMVKTQVASLAEAKAGAQAATARARQLEDEILRADGAKAAHKRDAKASIEEIRSQKERTENELRRQCGELEAQLRDSRAQAREGREKEEASQARLATLDGLQQERAKLVSSVEQLEAKLAEAHAENAQVEPLKSALREMEESKAKLEAEVLGTAQLVTEAELKLQTREQEFHASQEEISEIERNMGKLRKQVELEFERKLESLAADPSQWPEAMRKAVGDFERRLEEALVNLRRREEDLEDAIRQRDRARDENTDVLRRFSRMESELAASSGASEARLQSLTNQVKDLQEERDAAEKARQEKEEEVILLKVAHDKAANKMEGVDLVYLKNVLIKFLEVAFKPDMHQECMALLPAIGTLVGMGKEEFGRVQAAMQAYQSAASASGSSATSQVWAQLPSSLGSLQLNMPKFT
jgi:chromosome segregation ATPase